MVILRRWLAFLLLVSAAPLAAEPPAKPFDVIKLADGVYGFVWRSPLQDPIEGNALFVINDRDVLVVDTGLLPSSARRMAAALRRLTTKPVRYVVNTHWHDDHHNGNQVYRELWPGVEFIAHRNTRADMFAHTYDVRAEDLANMERDAASMPVGPRPARTTRASRWSRGGGSARPSWPRCTAGRCPNSARSAIRPRS